MGLQKHSKVLNDTVEMLSDEGSYHQLFHAYRDEEALPSGEVLKEIVDLCRAILFPGYYGNARIIFGRPILNPLQSRKGSIRENISKTCL